MFKILGLLSLSTAYSLSVLYMDGIKLGDMQVGLCVCVGTARGLWVGEECLWRVLVLVLVLGRKLQVGEH